MLHFEKSARDAVLVLAHRTAIARAKKGALMYTRPDELLMQLLSALTTRAQKLGVDPELIEDVLVGCAMPEGEQGLNLARIAAVGSGLPHTTCGVTINRFCSSGVETIATTAAKIGAGHLDVAIAGGVESMTMVRMGGNKPSMSPELIERAPDIYIGMGITAENVAEQFQVTRAAQDAFALASHKKATMAIERGHFDDEIIPIEAVSFDAKGTRTQAAFERDENVRPDASLEAMGALKPAFKTNGTVTAANSSPVTDGAALSLLMSRKTADRLGLEALGVVRGYATAGVDPTVMGIGPIPTVRKLLTRHGATIADLDVVELNEAFASQALACKKELGISDEQLNPNGGAIALGHPLGATGARMTATLLHELERRSGRFGIVTMCIGGGMGAACLFERES